MSTLEDDASARAVRMNQVLEELRLNTEDLHELATQAVERARRMVDDARATRLWLERQRARTNGIQESVSSVSTRRH